MSVNVQLTLSVGEFLDRYSIEQIRYLKGLISKKRIERLDRVFIALPKPLEKDAGWWLGRIEIVNERLWTLEDQPFNCERAAEIRRLNRRRSALKREIDEAFDSPTTEVKSDGWLDG